MSATGHEQDIAKLNGVRIRTWAAPSEVLLDAGRVIGMRFEETRELDGKLHGTGAVIDIAADAVFKAIGQLLDNSGLAGELTQGGDKVQVDARFRTATPGVYAGGDCIAPGMDLTVQAVQHGKLAALSIHHDLTAAGGI